MSDFQEVEFMSSLKDQAVTTSTSIENLDDMLMNVQPPRAQPQQPQTVRFADEIKPADDIQVIKSEDTAFNVNSATTESGGIQISRAPEQVPTPAPKRSWFNLPFGQPQPQQQQSIRPSTATTATTPATATDQLTPEQELVRKKELLKKLDRLERIKGLTGTKMGLGNTLAEIAAEVDNRTDLIEVEKSIQWYNENLVNFAQIVEGINERYNKPLGINLKGFSTAIYGKLDEFYDIFEELHDKYKGPSKLPPELRLAIALATTAFYVHITHTVLKHHEIEVPGISQVMNHNPELRAQYVAATAREIDPKFGRFVQSAGEIAGNGPPRREMRGPSATTAERWVPPPSQGPIPDLGYSGRIHGSGTSPRDDGSVHSGGTTETAKIRRGGGRKPLTAQPVGGSLSLSV